MIDVRQALLGAGEELPSPLRDAIVAAGPEAVPALLQILTDAARAGEDGPDDGWAAVHAATLLGALRAPEAASPLLAAYLEGEWGEYLKDRALAALEAVGAPALEPTLSAYAAASDDERRDDLCSVLSGLGVRDERIFSILLAQLSRTADAGAMNLAVYGDARALPALLEALDHHEVRLDALLRDGALIELDAAVTELGGALLPAHEAKLALADRLREAALRQRSAAKSAAPTRRERPGRNAPCWCGSDKKYKKCHLDEDEAGERAGPGSG